MPKPKTLQSQAPDIGLYLAIGVALGFMFGLMLQNVALGITFGLLLGLVLGVMKCSRAKSNNRTDDEYNDPLQ